MHRHTDRLTDRHTNRQTYTQTKSQTMRTFVFVISLTLAIVHQKKLPLKSRCSTCVSYKSSGVVETPQMHRQIGRGSAEPEEIMKLLLPCGRRGCFTICTLHCVHVLIFQFPYLAVKLKFLLTREVFLTTSLNLQLQQIFHLNI